MKTLYSILLFDIIIAWFIFIQFLPQILYGVIFICEHLFKVFVSPCLTKSLLQLLGLEIIRMKIKKGEIKSIY